MEEILNFLNLNPMGFMATVDEEGKPHVRTWEFMFEQDGKLWFYTSNDLDVFCELQCNPAVEFCSVSTDHLTVRVCGEVIFGIDLNIKAKMLEKSSCLRSMYKTPEHPEFEIFYLKHGKALMTDWSGETLKTVDF